MKRAYSYQKSKYRKIFTKTSRAVSVLLTVMVVTVSLGLLFVPYHRAFAATRTWDGGGGDANWSDNTETGTSDIANFDGTCVSNCSATVDTAVSVAGLIMASGYSGTITMGGSNNLTIGTSDYTQAAGIFTGGTGTLTLPSATTNADFTKTGGTFNSPTTMTFANVFLEARSVYWPSFVAARAVVIEDGKFFLRTSQPGSYELFIKRKIGGKEELIKQLHVVVGRERVVNHDIHLT